MKPLSPKFEASSSRKKLLSPRFETQSQKMEMQNVEYTSSVTLCTPNGAEIPGQA
jgi:hypothetical protein